MSDLIERQAALDMQYRIDDSATLSTRDVVNVEDIEGLPSVHAEPRTEHWIDRKVIEDIKAEIEEPLNENRIIDTDDARVQAIALMWCLQTIDKHLEKWEADHA